MSIREYFYTTLRTTFFMSLLLATLIGAAWGGMRLYFINDLPTGEYLKETNLQLPLRIFTQDGVFITEFGEQRCIPLAIMEIPPLLIKAILAAEDDRFFEHQGVDVKSVIRATVSLLKTGEIQQGGSTITMQVARNLFLSRERTFSRKFREMLLALKMESELEKDKILELYMNRVFFGNRAYGVGAAAQVYYGKDVQALTIAEWAMLAGLPKAPSTNNPLSNPEAALERRDYILKRMLLLDYITPVEYQTAVSESINVALHKLSSGVDAPYIAEMVRSHMVEKFGDAAYTAGYKVTTTIDSRLQNAAQTSLRNALFYYDERHGYRGAMGRAKLPKDNQNMEEIKRVAAEVLQKYPVRGNLIPSVVYSVKFKKVAAYSPQIGEFEVDWSDLAWARRYVRRDKQSSSPDNAWEVLRRGDIIMVRPILELPEPEKPVKEKANSKKSKTDKKAKTDKKSTKGKVETAPIEEPKKEEPPVPKTRWRLAEVPEVEGAIVSLNSKDGAIVALAGGFDFYQSKFNRVTQAERQPGSSFKPFIYSAALNHGFNRGSAVNDAPIVINTGVNNKIWRPQNYSRTYYGFISLEKALIHSRNLASIYLLRKVGVDRTIDYITRFGFERERIPRNLTIALGTVTLTPLKLAKGFTVFANGGYLIEPYFIQKIEDMNGDILHQADPLKVCHNCRQVVAKEGGQKGDVKKAKTDVPSLPTAKEGKEELLPLKKEKLGKERLGLVGLMNQSVAAEVEEQTDSSKQPIPRYAPQVISSRNAQEMTTILQGVIRKGTGKAASRQLKRKDIAGKTGTTNDQYDAWFAGYNPDLVAVSWVGFDRPRSLGYGETGGRAALPMWIEYMSVALEGKPLHLLQSSNAIMSVSNAPDDIAEGRTSGRTSKRKDSKQAKSPNRRNKNDVRSSNKDTKDTKNTNDVRSSKNTTVKKSTESVEKPKPKKTVIPDQLF